MDKQEVLRRYFGHGEFREGQETLIDALLAGRDALGIMPTGGGKSLCYQVPALLLPGVTLVISPLISLMKDQVMALEKAGSRRRFSIAPFPLRSGGRSMTGCGRGPTGSSMWLRSGWRRRTSPPWRGS